MVMDVQNTMCHSAMYGYTIVLFCGNMLSKLMEQFSTTIHEQFDVTDWRSNYSFSDGRCQRVFDHIYGDNNFTYRVSICGIIHQFQMSNEDYISCNCHYVTIRLWRPLRPISLNNFDKRKVV